MRTWVIKQNRPCSQLSNSLDFHELSGDKEVAKVPYSLLNGELRSDRAWGPAGITAPVAVSEASRQNRYGLCGVSTPGPSKLPNLNWKCCAIHWSNESNAVQFMFSPRWTWTKLFAAQGMLSICGVFSCHSRPAYFHILFCLRVRDSWTICFFLHLPKTKLVCLGARIHQALKSESATIKMLG